MNKLYCLLVGLLTIQPLGAAQAASFVTGQSGAGYGSRLGANDRIVICPFGDPANTGATTAHIPGQGRPVDNCFSVSNSSPDKEYFVPWNTEQEWEKFLNAQRGLLADYQAGKRSAMPDMTLGVVCPLQGQVTICKNTALERTLDANSFNQREVGVLPQHNNPPLGHYAAQGDVYSLDLTPSDAVTLTCSSQDVAGQGGRWVLTTAPDSCKDDLAKCADNVDQATIKPWLASDPQLLENIHLCAAGNKVTNTEFRYHSPESWSWICHGAHGSTKQCSGGFVKRPIDGECGYFAGQKTDHILSDEYYTDGVYDPYRHFCDVGEVTDYRQTESGWSWRCSGVNGGQKSAVCAAEFEVVNGVCGAANNTAVPTAPNIQSGNLCASGFASPTTASYADGIYSWGCYGNNPPATSDQQCQATQCAACEGVNQAPSGFAVGGKTTLQLPTGQSCAVDASAAWVSSTTARTAELGDSLTYENSGYRLVLAYQNVAEETRCQPCYKAAQDYQHLKITVTAEAGSCPAIPALNAGDPVELR